MCKISVVLGGRNDGYADDYVLANGGSPVATYLNRIRYCIESLHSALQKIDYEIILMDINALEEEEKLSSIFSHPRIKHIVFSKDFYMSRLRYQMENGIEYLLYEKKNTKLYKKMTLEDMSSNNFCYGFFLNKILHSNFISGEYILSTSCNVIFPKNFENIVNNVRPNILYRCKKEKVSFRDFNEQFFYKIVNREDMSNYFIDTSKADSVYKAIGDFLLMDKNSWAEIGGYLPFLSSRVLCADGLFLMFALSCGKKILPIDKNKYYIVDIDIVSPNINYNNMNFIISKDGFHYNHLKEVTNNRYKKFRNWMKKQNYDGKLVYRNFGDIEIMEKFKKYFKDMYGGEK
jgi:hypothetical protein